MKLTAFATMRLTASAKQWLTAAAVAALPVGLGLALLATPIGVGSPRPAAATVDCPGDAGSAMTKNGAGAFASLQITVCQTTQLVNQVVAVQWSGGTPTDPTGDPARFQRNYLQIMECWGDDATGPRREQCQWGGLDPDTGRAGLFVNSRQVYSAGRLEDPAETYKPATGRDSAWVPFESVTGETLVDGKVNDLYDRNTNNQISLARTRPDGTGLEFFEIQTGREAPGLGCANPVEAAGGAPRSCWLVVVPRSNVEVGPDGGTPVTGDWSLPTTDKAAYLQSSPLSASNWEHRIVFPLTFSPLASVCELGSAERPTLGDEMVTEAVSRWQPAVCGATGKVYSFGQVSDDLVRTDLQSDQPSLGFISKPLPADAVLAAGKPVYAPAAISGLAITFNIDSQSLDTAPDDVKQRNGQRITELKLTPRVVAKLLTQSYRAATKAPEAIPNNPQFLIGPGLGGKTAIDPDFLADNPQFKDLYPITGIWNLLTPVGSADVFDRLWAWVAGDQAARDFLDGKPDPWGAVVNPNYKSIPLPRSDLPKSDLACEIIPAAPNEKPQDPFCPDNAYPSTLDMHEANRAVSRGDSMVKSVWDNGGNLVPGSYKKAPAQAPGSRSLLAVSDTATAIRYSLPTAQLRNASGKFVTPTEQTLLAGVAAAKSTDISGVLQPDPRALGDDVYPLTSITYAAAVPSAVPSDARKDYAAFLRYVAGPGQHPGLELGDLPPGYVPLTSAMKAQTLAAATAIETAPDPQPTPTQTGGTASGAEGGTGGTGDSGAPGGGLNEGQGVPAGSSPSASASVPSPGLPPSAGPAAPAAPPAATPAAAVGKTPASPIGGIRHALIVILIVGGVAAGGSRVLSFTARARPQRGG